MNDLTVNRTATIEDLSVNGEKAVPGRFRYKRPFDLTILLSVHLLFLWLWLPLWALISLAVWLENRGSIFYKHRRVGKGGKVFSVLKFRSMVEDAERLTGPVWASERDPRVTKVGRVLRATALDELPQLLMILKGDMSLVGPRPERPELAADFAQKIPGFNQRLQIQPGLTGAAQVYGQYDSPPPEKLEYDLWYVKHASPWVDLKLLFLSAWVTLRGKWESRSKKF